MHLEIDLSEEREDNEYTHNKVFVRAGKTLFLFLIVYYKNVFVLLFFNSI